MEQERRNLEPVLASIMTHEAYAETRHGRPYIFELNHGPKELCYVGAGHTNNPDSPLFDQIEASFEKAQPEMVFVEGFSTHMDKNEFNEQIKTASREQVIEQMGESGFTIKLGVEHGLDWHSPEPTDKEQYAYLVDQGFSHDEIFAWDIVHMLPQYYRQVKKTTFQEYVEQYRLRFIENTEWENFDYSYDRAVELIEGIVGHSFEVNSEEEAKDFVDPIPWEDKKVRQTVFNRLSAASNLLRDRKIVTDIANALETYDRLFVVYGASHAVMQEPALRKLFAEM
jgi:hypothetical protein